MPSDSVCSYCKAEAGPPDQWRYVTLWREWPHGRQRIPIPRCARCRRRQRTTLRWLIVGSLLLVVGCLSWPNYKVLAGCSALPDPPPDGLAVVLGCMNLCLLVVLWPVFLVGRGIWRHIYIVRHSNAADLLRDGWQWSEQPRHE